MRKADISIGGVYSNGKGRIRRILDIGPQYKLYPGAASEENVRYEIVCDGSAKNATAGQQANMSLQAFASWAKQEASDIAISQKEVSAMASAGLDIPTAVSLLEKKMDKDLRRQKQLSLPHPCDPAIEALQMAIEALKESEWVDTEQQLPELPDEDVCGLPLLVKTSEAPDTTTFMVYQRSCSRGKRKERWWYQGHIYDGSVLRWRRLPK